MNLESWTGVFLNICIATIGMLMFHFPIALISYPVSILLGLPPNLFTSLELLIYATIVFMSIYAKIKHDKAEGIDLTSHRIAKNSLNPNLSIKKTAH